MKDLVGERARKDDPDTWFYSTKQIDGAFAAPYVDFYGARFIPFWSVMGDHNYVAVEVTHQSLLGDKVLKMFRTGSRRLQFVLIGPKRQYLQK